LGNANSNALFGVKINSSGVPQWSVEIDGIGNDQVFGSCVDTGGNLYISGSYDSSPIIYNSNNSIFNTLTASTYPSAFLTKYNTSGVAQWATMIKGVSGSNIVNNLITDCNNNIYLTGTYQGTVSPIITDNTGTNTGLVLPVPTGNGGSNLASFMIKYNSNGTPLIAYGMYGESNTIANGVAISGSNIYIAGNMFNNPKMYDNSLVASSLTFPGTITTQAGFIAQYIPTLASYYLPSSLGSNYNGFQKYITNASTSNIILKIMNSNNTTMLNTYTINVGSNALFHWFNNSWYKMY
jgi:hypothetical protein